MCPASVSSMAPVTSVAMISKLIKSAEYSMSAGFTCWDGNPKGSAFLGPSVF